MDGDLHVHLRVAVPKKLNDEQKELLRKLEKSLESSAAAGENTVPSSVSASYFSSPQPL
jgi:DnaJ-class molecular chaperone